MDEDQRLNFNSFVDAYDAYQNPNLAAAAPAFAGYGYQAPQLNMVQAPQQMPQMGMNPNAIYDPSVAAAMQILNNPMMIAQAPDLLGAGTDYQNQYSLLRDIAPTKLQQYERIAAPQPPQGLMDYVGGGDGTSSGNYGNNEPSNLAADNFGSSMPPGYFTGYDVTWNSGGDWTNGNGGGMADTYGTPGYGGEQYGDSPMGTY
jgi:hypothetical protein